MKTRKFNGVTYRQVDTRKPYYIELGDVYFTLRGEPIAWHKSMCGRWSDGDDSVWRPTAACAADSIPDGCIDAGQLEDAMDLLDLLANKCSSLSLDDKHDRTALAVTLLKHGYSKGQR